MHELMSHFCANGFPLWIVIVGLIVAAIRLTSVGGRICAFDRQTALPLRGLLVILVVIGHLKANCSWASEWLPWVGWQTPAVAVFFFLSGYGLCQGFASKGERYLSGFLRRSFEKLLIPIMPIVIVYCLWLQCQGRFIPLFLRFWQDGNTPVPNTWYVYALLLMYGVWWMSWRSFAKSSSRLVALWLGVLAYFCVMEFALDWNFVWARTILAFPIGATFSVNEKRIHESIIHSPPLFYLAVIVLLLMAIAIRALFPTGIVAIAGRGLTSTLGIFVVLVWYAMPLLDFRVLNYLGSISYELYLVHGVVIAWAWPLLKCGFFAFACVVVIVSLPLAVALRFWAKIAHKIFMLR